MWWLIGGALGIGAVGYTVHEVRGAARDAAKVKPVMWVGAVLLAAALLRKRGR